MGKRDMGRSHWKEPREAGVGVQHSEAGGRCVQSPCVGSFWATHLRQGQGGMAGQSHVLERNGGMYISCSGDRIHVFYHPHINMSPFLLPTVSVKLWDGCVVTPVNQPLRDMDKAWGGTECFPAVTGKASVHDRMKEATLMISTLSINYSLSWGITRES